jgi:CRP/FNR family transcriptional regulator, cyclic AMP receptor protein
MSDAAPATWIKQIPLFRTFSEEECRHLEEIAARRVFHPGETVLQQGALSQEMWVLLEGKCEVVKQVDVGQQREIVLATLEPYSNFGEMSFFHSAPHSASVRAQTHVELLCITRAEFDRLIACDSKVACKLAINTVHSLAERMRRMDEWVAELITKQPAEPSVPEMARLRAKLFDSWQL